MTKINHTQSADVIIVGGGLAGLTAATYLGRAGHKVLLFDKGKNVGGRARTRAKGQYLFNMGAHALYRKGMAEKVLAELGVSFGGGMPNVGGYMVNGGQKYLLPAGALTLLSTKGLGWRAKFEVAKLLGSINRVDSKAIQHLTVQEWIEQRVSQPETQALLRALFRVSTYGNDPTRQSAEVAVAQFQMALSTNVYYLDGGWQTLVDGLQKAAEAANVTIMDSQPVKSVEMNDQQMVNGVKVSDGTVYSVSAVMIAGSPTVAANLLPNVTAITQWAKEAIPVTAACLDLALKRLPEPKATFALALDQPLYLSVHSAVAKLAPQEGAMIHLLKYLGPTGSNPQQDSQQLEAFADLIQPGWRDELIEKRFLPKMVASNRLVLAAQGGRTGRPQPTVPGIPNLFVAGDWVGSEGLLADTSFASAKQAATLCIQHLRGN